MDFFNNNFLVFLSFVCVKAFMFLLLSRAKNMFLMNFSMFFFFFLFFFLLPANLIVFKQNHSPNKEKKVLKRENKIEKPGSNELNRTGVCKYAALI